MIGGRKLTIFLALWVLGFILVYILFFPIKGDILFHFPPIYIYLLTTVLTVWVLCLFFKIFRFGFAVKISIIVLIVAIAFPVASYYYNGRLTHLCNAARYNHSFILDALSDASNKDEVKQCGN